MDKVSVIVTCYNHGEFIGQCLKSIFEQTHQSIELIVINDGSTDRSAEVIQEALKTSPFKETKYIYEDNSGACTARNRGLDSATGDFILFVDADNFLDKDHIEKSLLVLKSTQSDIAYCSQKNGETQEIVNEVPEFSLGRLITANYIDTCSLFRTSILNGHRFDEKLNRLFMQDYDFYLGLIHDGAKAIKVPNLYLNYRIIESSVGNRGVLREERVKWLEVYAYINGKYPEYARNATNMLGSWFMDLNLEMKNSEVNRRAVSEENIELIQKNKSIDTKLNQIQGQYQQLDNLYLSIVHSKSWKIGRILTHPYRKLLKIKKKIFKETTSKQISGDSYQDWIDHVEKKGQHDLSNLNTKYQPLVSILIPVYNVERKWLIRCIESIKQQTYSNWEICIADDCSSNMETIETLKGLKSLDERIHIIFREENGNISAATNSALDIASGEFIALVDNDDELAPNALFEVVATLNKNRDLDIIYSDEDKINQDGKRFDPHFKPAWSPDLILNQNYISHLGIYRTSIAKRIGGFRLGFEGVQDHDFLLRFVEQISEEHIVHIPKILYHWRAIEGSTALEAGEKSYAYERGVRAVQEALDRRGVKGTVNPGKYPGLYEITYDILVESLVSIIIPTKNGYDDVKKCIDSIMTKSTYENYEVIVADNGSDDPKLIELFANYEKKLPNRFKSVRLDIPFNYSRINNLAVDAASGEYLLFLNNDTEVISPNWIESMLGFAQFPRVGCVGAKLWYTDGTIQHGGVILGIGGIAGHAFLNATKDDPGYFSRLYTDYNYTVVTAACLMVSRDDFNKVNGFDETLAVAFNDVDFCLRVFQLGRNNVWAHKAELYHYESKSRGYEDTPQKVARFNKEISKMNARYGGLLQNDPAYNVNFDLFATPFSRLKK